MYVIAKLRLFVRINGVKNYDTQEQLIHIYTQRANDVTY